MSQPRPITHRSLARAALETLENRRLLAFSGGNFDVPVHLDFSFPVTGVEDTDGENIGFPIVQGNDLGDEYQPELIDLDRDDGMLLLTSRGTSTAGSNFGDDNTLANGLQMPFDASEDWVVHTRISAINAPLTQFDAEFEQAGLLVGPSQDNYVKLVYGFNGSNPIVQFLAEFGDGAGNYSYPLGESGATSVVTSVQGVDLNTADYIDLWLAGDADTGVISAQYRVEGGQTIRFDETLALSESRETSFFRAEEARAGLMVAHKNDSGPITTAFDEFEIRRDGLPTNQPMVDQARPGDGDTDVARDAFIAVDLELPNASIAGSTVNTSNVHLVRVEDNRPVDVVINTTGGGDSIIVTPTRALDANTEYRFSIDSGVEDLYGVSFVPFESTFTTGYAIGSGGTAGLGQVAFEQISLPTTSGTIWSSVNIGPDNRLYATSIDGTIARWAINSDGTLGSQETIDSLTDAEGGPRVITGLTFAPDATAENLVAYVTHTQFNDVTTDNPSELGDDFTGKVTRLSGPALGTVRDLVTGLPRSIRDHLTNQPVFGPDGRLYVPQGANSAMGAGDPAWAFRPERLLTASVLAMDIDALEARSTPLSVKTAEGGNYDPFAANAPVTLYATGVRNAYDLVWHSNGNLYAPTNGSAAGGNTPESPQPNDSEFGDDRVDLDINGPFTGDFVPALNNVQQTQNDYLFNIEQGGYYGHPNPTRDEWVLNGGNPTSSDDLAQVDAYPVGTQPDRNWRGFVYDFGKNISPNGSIEYTSDSFGGALQGKLIVTRYSGGDDLIVLDLDENGNVINATTGLPGLEGFADPLDLTQTSDGALYVTEFASQEITLLRPVEAEGNASVASRRIYFDAAAGETATRPFTVRNTGLTPLAVNGRTLSITGPDKTSFQLVSPPDQVILQPGEDLDVEVEFIPDEDTEVGDVFEATVYVLTSDPEAPEIGSKLFGFVKRGEDGVNEPSLQDIFDLYGLGIDSGDPDPSDNEISFTEILDGDGIAAQLFEAADPTRPVAVETIASYSPQRTPTLSFGYYSPGTPSTRMKLGEVETSQGIDPVTNAASKFTPDSPAGRFGLYLQSNALLDPVGGGISDTRGRVVYTESALNTWESTAAERDKVAVYPIPGIENAYAVSFEEYQLETDYNDLVLVMTNVRPVEETGGRLAITDPVGEVASERIIFSTIPDANRDDRFGEQQVREVRTVTLTNVGDTTLSLDSVDVDGPFTVNSFTPGSTLAPGASTDLTVRFTATDEGTGDGTHLGSLVIEYTPDTSDASVPAATRPIPLAGYFMPYSEDDVASGVQKENEEPTLNEIVNLFGYNTDVGTPAERLTGTSDAVGDEVLSEFWQAAQEDLPVEVYQLVAFHNTNTSDAIYWFPRSAATSEASAAAASNLILTHDNVWGQSFLPGIDGGTAPAAATFTPGDTEFGFRVVNEYSVDAFNDESGGQNDLHLFRFYPLINSDGSTVEDAYLVTMDFTGFNFDYNDNVYVVRNIQPADAPAGPIGLTRGEFPGNDVGVFWARPEGIDRVRVFRSDGDRDNFVRVGERSALENFIFGDVDGEEPVYVRVQGVDADGSGGAFSEIRIA